VGCTGNQRDGYSPEIQQFHVLQPVSGISMTTKKEDE
jgi:hypothetical protein